MKQDYIQLTVPEGTIRTNQLQSKAERYRTRGGVPTIRDTGLAKMILDRDIMKLSQPENLDLLRWAHSVINYQK
jgi:hypothetical protein